MAIKTSAARSAALTVVCLSVAGVCAQTVIKLPKNKYTPEQDVKLGKRLPPSSAAVSDHPRQANPGLPHDARRSTRGSGSG